MDGGRGKEVPRGWSSESVGSRLQHAIFYSLIYLRAGWIVSSLLHAVVLYYVIFRPCLRNRAHYYISRRFPGLGGLARLRAIFRLDLNLGRVLVDRAFLGIVGPETIKASFQGKKLLRDVADEGKGLVLLTAHVGGWQVVMASLRFLNRPINLLVHREEGDIDRFYFEHGDGPSPFRMIDPAGPMGGMLDMMEVLKKGEVLCVMGDRLFGSSRGAVSVPFLGDPVSVPFSVFKIASVTGSPIAVIFSHRTGPGAYELTLDRVIRVPTNAGRSGSEFIPYVRQFIEGLERFTDAHPFQFFNFFDMWERKESGFKKGTENDSGKAR